MTPEERDFFTTLCVYGQLTKESTWQLDALSPKGAQGIWQIIPDHAADVDLFNDPLGATGRAVWHHNDVYEDVRSRVERFEDIYGVSTGDILIPIIIQGYISGVNGIKDVMDWFLENYSAEDVRRELGEPPYGMDFFRFMTEEAYKNRNHPDVEGSERGIDLFGPQSLAYVPASMAMGEHMLRRADRDALFPSPNTDLLSNRNRLVNDGLNLELVSHSGEGNLDSGETYDFIEAAANSRNLLAGVEFEGSGRVNRFLESEPSQDQVNVNRWLTANDRAWNQYRSGFSDNEALENFIKARPDLFFDLNRANLTVFASPYTDGDQPWQRAGIREDWRRVIRVDQVDILDGITRRLNEILYENGMNRNYYITPAVNGTVRSVQMNNSLSDSSSTSAHLSFSAVDYANTFYVGNIIDSESGTVLRFESDIDMSTYRAALRQAVYDSAQAGEIFARFHGNHFHVVLKSNTDVEAQECSNNSDQDCVLVPVPRRRLADWVDEVCPTGIDVGDVRELNGFEREFDGSEEQRISPGDIVEIPEDCQ
jgi:hypothetical protein